MEDTRALTREASLPTSFDRHVYFTNFSSFGSQNPVYINLVRDPIAKMVSRFYYADLRQRGPGLFEKCVAAEGVQCRLLQGQPYDLTIPYFCGHEKWCS